MYVIREPSRASAFYHDNVGQHEYGTQKMEHYCDASKKSWTKLIARSN